VTMNIAPQQTHSETSPYALQNLRGLDTTSRDF